ncbi:MAG: ABC transporter ATP-binding protein [Blastocatellia bacterium]
MSDVVIRVENLGKKYTIQHQREREQYVSLRDVIANRAKSLFQKSQLSTINSQLTEDFWALKDVSFEIKQGEVVGIIGRNGAGKSTLLKILSRITEPTNGRIGIKGRVASLLEVGTGFHPELTGRENIYLNGAILGMSREEIKRKFDEIVAFAEVEKFLDTPVKRYSSGMYVRLAFAVAAHLEPEILIVDEVLAVGDAQFQKKCLGKMDEVAKGGRTVLFVSHNMAMIQFLCSKAILLDKGSINSEGNVQDVIQQYSNIISRNATPIVTREDRLGTGRLRITDLRILEGNNEKSVISCGAPVSLEITYESVAHLEMLRSHIVIDALLGDHILYLGTDLMAQDFLTPPSRGKIMCHLSTLPLMPGSYVINVYCVANNNETLFDGILDAARFDVIEGDFYGNGVLPPRTYAKILVEHTWSMEQQLTLNRGRENG